MGRSRVAALLAGLSLAACEIAPDHSTAPETPISAPDLDEQLQAITALLSGDYFSDAAGGAREGRPIYLRVRSIMPPEGHRYAMYSEMRHDGPEGPFYRQLIYLFDEAADRTENRMHAYRVTDPDLAALLVEDASGFATGLVEIGPPLSDDCYMVWEASASGYESWIDPERCVITGKRGDQRRIESRMQITESAIGQLERGYTLDRDLLFGNPSGELYIWPRVNPNEAD